MWALLKTLLVQGILAKTLLRSFGWLCALGEICTLAAALTLVPAGAALLFRRHGVPAASPSGVHRVVGEEKKRAGTG